MLSFNVDVTTGPVDKVQMVITMDQNLTPAEKRDACKRIWAAIVGLAGLVEPPAALESPPSEPTRPSPAETGTLAAPEQRSAQSVKPAPEAPAQEPDKGQAADVDKGKESETKASGSKAEGSPARNGPPKDVLDTPFPAGSYKTVRDALAAKDKVYLLKSKAKIQEYQSGKVPTELKPAYLGQLLEGVTKALAVLDAKEKKTPESVRDQIVALAKEMGDANLGRVEQVAMHTARKPFADCNEEELAKILDVLLAVRDAPPTDPQGGTR